MSNQYLAIRLKCLEILIIDESGQIVVIEITLNDKLFMNIEYFAKRVDGR